jgi:hypothetical protein
VGHNCPLDAKHSASNGWKSQVVSFPLRCFKSGGNQQTYRIPIELAIEGEFIGVSIRSGVKMVEIY